MKKLLLFLTVFFVSVNFFSSTKASVPPGDTWFTLFTDHFRVHHTQAQESYAKEFARELEIAFPKLTKDLGNTPHTPIDIVVNDVSDSANGMSFGFPHNRMEVYAVPFDNDSVLMDYHNWVEELATHELTHIIANDTSLGAYKFFRKIFGEVVKPNGIQPNWIVEGLAVFEETEQTSGGRGRSALTEALLRTAIRDQILGKDHYISLDRFNDGVFWWPAGNIPYLMGYTVQSAAETYNFDRERTVAGRINTLNASRFPFQPNSNAESAVGKDWPLTWELTQKRLQERYAKENLQSTPGANFTRLTHGGKFTGGQARALDGWIYFTLQDKEIGHALARLRADGKTTEPEILEKKDDGGPTQVAVSPSGKLVAFSVTHTIDAQKNFNDIRVYNVEKKSSHYLTNEKRAFDPSFISENEILYVRNRGDGTQAIERMNIVSKVSSEIYRSKIFERISTPTVHEDTVYFSIHHNNATEEIRKISVTANGTQTAAAVIPPLAKNKGTSFFEKNPSFDAAGNLYFSASYPELTGKNIYDIYRFKKSANKPELVLRSSSGMLLHPTPLPNGSLLVNEYSAEGFDLNTASPLVEKNPIAPATEDLHRFLTSGSQRKKATPHTSTVEALPQKTKDYDLLSTPATSLWPQYWVPQWTASLDGSLLGASTSGMDPLGQNTYSLSALYDTRASFPTYNFLYTNRSYRALLNLYANQSNNYIQSSRTSNRISLYGLETALPFTNFAFTFGTAFQTSNYYFSQSQSMFIYHQLAYSNYSQTPSAIDPNSGVYASTYTSLHPANTFDTNYVESRSRAFLFTRGIHPSHSVGTKLFFSATTNRFLASNYYLGGGASPLSSTEYIVRGYYLDSLLGTRIATANFSYTIPLAKPYRGWSTNPVFLKDIGIRLLADAGTANYLARYDSSSHFISYKAQALGERTITGIGLDSVWKGTLFYYAPVELDLGVHRGLQKKFGGTTLFYLAINSAINLF